MKMVIDFIDLWLGGLSGVLISFAGILFCILLINAFWDRRIRVLELIVLGFCSIALAFYQVTSSSLQRIFEVEQSTVVCALFFLTLSGFVYTSLREMKISTTAKSLGKDCKSTIFSEETVGREIRGTNVGVPLVITLSAFAVLLTGLSAPQVMVGDEVTHYYMLTYQAEDLSKPNFYANIPIATGEIEERRYPHSFFWHYGGAVIYRLTGGSFTFIQLYQTFFLIQLLIVGYLIARDRQGVESRSALLYVIALASLPLSLIFSVTFYQDVPMTAQILTSFYFLRKGRWFLASLFLALAIGCKVTAVLFYPAFFLLLFYWAVRKTGWVRGSIATVCSLVIVMCITWLIGSAIETYGQATFYPQQQLERLIKKVHKAIKYNIPDIANKRDLSQENTNLSVGSNIKKNKEQRPPIIANHPGDLRIKQNFLIYGGAVVWLLVLLGVIGMLYYSYRFKDRFRSKESNIWPFLVGGSYTLLAAWFIKTSPDARFFLPGLPFLLLPFVEKVVCLPRTKVIISIIAALAFLQSGFVLSKTYRLRAITPALQDGIDFLKVHPPVGRIFMYPEGNYRFFPAQHEWYLGYQLRDFWRADNDERVRLLERYHVSVVVIKRHLVSTVNEQITNLGVYPVQFVKDIDDDLRFEEIFSNRELIMYSVKSGRQNL